MTAKSKIVTKKIDWPDHVSDVDVEMWDNLSWDELRALLAVLGLPLSEQPKPKKKEALVDKLIEYVARDTVLAQYAYETFVLRTTPKGYVPSYTAFTDNRFKDDVRELLTRLKTDLGDEFRHGLQDVSQKAAEKIMKDWLDERVQTLRPIEVRQPDKPARKIKGIVHEKFERICQLAAARKNICLVGPSGSGKTHTAEQVAVDGLGMPFGAQSMSAGVSESSFTGWLLPMGKGGEYVHVATTFLEIYENGGVFLFDEMDNADANMLVFLNMALGNKQFYLPQRKDKPVVRKHKDFVAIAAMNTYGHGADAKYVGRAQLDGATLDRFRVGMVTMDYDTNVERALCEQAVLTWGWKIRAAIDHNGLNRIMSTRTLIDGSDMLRTGWTLAQVAEGYFADWTAEERRLIGG